MTKITAISGSLRQGSFNTALLKALSTLTADAIVEVVTVHGVPLFNEDEEKVNGIPKVVEDIKLKIAEADGLIISTPEYNSGIPGVLKNAFDWFSRPPKDIAKVFNNKSVAIMGATIGTMGTISAQTSWLPTIRALGMRPCFKRQLYVSSAQDKFDADKNLIDEVTAKQLTAFISDFVDFIKNK